ncbi:MAG: VOC family protein [Spirochaetaceae bacterium]|jgi:2-dehydro-3-deoxyphosphogluconate aldolase/(4S)-4-hydroxy-2-oxoglutarate aldolase|nr:VOC family protein [Spirochaetaceae bacterium]
MDDELKKLHFTVKHFGINTPSMEEAEKAAGAFNAAFGFEADRKSASIFSTPYIELMGQVGLGTHGHIAVGTSDIEAARAYLQKKGYSFVEGSERYKDGKLLTVYLVPEFAGFAVHLLQEN